MTLGVFVQINTDSKHREKHPIGYMVQESGCWDWVGARAHGYGVMWDSDQARLRRAHRLLYEKRHSPIPSGYECHHKCENKACVNPDHLEIITRKEHCERDPAMKGGLAVGWTQRREQIHCKHGHPLSGDNLYVAPKSGCRMCRACRIVQGAARGLNDD